MLLAVSSTSNSLDSPICPSFGRCPYFIFAEVENGEIKKWEGVENVYVNAFRGAGIATAQLVASKKPEAVITGNMGPNSYAALSSVGIKVYVSPMVSVREAIKLFLDGKLQEMIRPAGRWRWRRGWGWGRRW